MKKLNLKELRNSNFKEMYYPLLCNAEISNEKLIKLLKIAIVFLSADDDYLKKLGYKIILLYGNKTGDYIPLYDVSLNLGYIPVSKLIERKMGKELFGGTFFKEFQAAFQETFRKNSTYLSFGQQELNSNFKKPNSNESFAVIAPTSFGKSELITSTLDEDKNICIVVPTKALLAQTKKRIMNSESYAKGRKIVTHHEMYNLGDRNFIAVLTQERLVRLLQYDKSLAFDIAFIDEAHNLLDNTGRNHLLATAIMMLKNRSASVRVHFLTPFLLEANNLKVKFTSFSLKSLRIDEYIKTERVHVCDFRENGDKQLKLYDPFLNEFTDLKQEKTYENYLDLLIDKSGNKNIIYVNAPKDIQSFALELAERLPEIQDFEINKAIESIADFLDVNYSLLKCMKNGVIYHHGAVPDNVKLYIENLFSSCRDLKYIVTNTTLLEGVNIPADKLFLKSGKVGKTKHLTAAQLKNLIGRVCRFKEVFDESSGNLKLLEPEVFFLGSDCYTKKKPKSLPDFIKDRLKIDKKLKEKAENLLLENSDRTEDNKLERDKLEDFLENVEPNITGRRDGNYAATEVGKLCFQHNILEFDIVENEVAIQTVVDDLRANNYVALSSNELIELMNNLFFKFIPSNSKDRVILRLKEKDKARDFYAMFFEKKMANPSYKQMIASFVFHWNKTLERKKNEAFVYVGRWGDSNRGAGGYYKDWGNLWGKSDAVKVNLAIVRIKEEQEFVSYMLMKFVEVINDLSLINGDTYLKIKFSTSDPYKILLIRNGFSSSLSTLLINKYKEYLSINLVNNTVTIKPGLYDKMKEYRESEILIHEVTYIA